MLVDLGFAAPSAERALRSGTPRYIAALDDDLGDAEARDLLAFGAMLAEATDETVRAAARPIDVARTRARDLELSDIVAPLLSPAPTARPRARWVAEVAIRKLGGASETVDAGRRAVRATAICVRVRRFREGRAHTDAAPYLAAFLAWEARIDETFGGAASRDEIALLDAAGVARWLTLLVGPTAASWPLGAIADRGERVIAEAFERLACERIPSAWRLADVENAFSHDVGPHSTRGREVPAARVARLAIAISEVPPDVEALAEIEADPTVPSMLVQRAAHVLRLRGEAGRAAALAERGATSSASARADLAEHYRRAGDATRATHEAEAARELPAARAVLGRIALDRGAAAEALQVVEGAPTARTLEVEALAHAAMGATAEAVRALDRASAYAANDEDRARIDGARGYVLTARDPDAAREAYGRAVDHAERAGAVVEEATYLTGVAALSIDSGFLEVGIRAGTRAALLWEGLGRAERAARAYLACAVRLTTLGRSAGRSSRRSPPREGARRPDHRALAYAHVVAADRERDDADRFEAETRAAVDALALLGAGATADDRLYVMSRRLAKPEADVDVDELDALASSLSASAGARLDWWRARAMTLPADERADTILAAIVALASSTAPLASRGSAHGRDSSRSNVVGAMSPSAYVAPRAMRRVFSSRAPGAASKRKRVRSLGSRGRPSTSKRRSTASKRTISSGSCRASEAANASVISSGRSSMRSFFGRASSEVSCSFARPMAGSCRAPRATSRSAISKASSAICRNRSRRGRSKRRSRSSPSTRRVSSPVSTRAFMR